MCVASRFDPNIRGSACTLSEKDFLMAAGNSAPFRKVNLGHACQGRHPAVLFPGG